MIESKNRVRVTISEEIMLARLAQSEQMRAFFIEMWKQNPALAKQGGAKVRNLLTQLEGIDLEAKPFPAMGRGLEGSKQRGISLVELIMFIVIVSVALAGILLVMNVTTKNSADPIIHKQALAIAESLLEEVELMPFTFCDPDDLNAASAVSATVGGSGCNSTVEAPGPENAFAEQPTAETRYSSSTPFDNVNDYHGCQMNTGVANAGCDSTGTGGIRDITNTPVSAALDGYSATVTVVGQSIGGIAAAESLLIKVSVIGPDDVPVVVEGVRTRYAPRTTP